MTITLNVPDGAIAQLRADAEAKGMTLEQYAEERLLASHALDWPYGGNGTTELPHIPAPHVNTEWDVLNRERAALIKRKVTVGLNAEEQLHLDDLQRQSRNHVDAIAPLPSYQPLDIEARTGG